MIQKEIRSLTGIRGVAALFVAVFHYYQFYATNFIEKEKPVFNKYVSSFFIHGYLSVDLFFILSAFVMTLSSKKLFEGNFSFKNYKFFMQKRWIRIYPSYFFVAVYGYMFVMHFNRTPNFILSLTLLNLVFGTSHILGHLWSLGAEWISYILYPLFLKTAFYRNTSKWNTLIVVLGLLALYVASITFHKNMFQDFTLEIYQGYSCLLRCFGGYFLGIISYKIFINNHDKNTFFATISIPLSLLIIILLFLPIADFLIVLLFVPFISTIAFDDNLISKVLGSKVIYFLGQISYPLYLINSLVFLKLENINNYLLSKGLVNNRALWLSVIFFLLVIGISYVFTFFIEKNIILFLSKKLKENKFPFRLQKRHSF